MGSTGHRAAWQPNWINRTNQGSQCRATAHAEAKAALLRELSRGCNLEVVVLRMSATAGAGKESKVASKKTNL